MSTYYHVQRVMGLKGSFSEFLTVYLRGSINGSIWADYVRSWLDSPLWSTQRIVRVKYEDMKANPSHELRRAVELTGYQPTDDEIEDGIDAGRLDAMQKREQVSTTLVHRETEGRIAAVRKGEVGDWRNHFSADDLKKFYAVNRTMMERVGYEIE